jgi:hypothetical protein
MPHSFCTKELLNIFNDLCSIHVAADGVAVPPSQILRHLRRLKTGGSLKSCPTKSTSCRHLENYVALG